MISLFIYHGVRAPAQAHLRVSLDCSFILLTSLSRLPNVPPELIFLNKEYQKQVTWMAVEIDISSLSESLNSVSVAQGSAACFCVDIGEQVHTQLRMGQFCPILTRIGVGLPHSGNLPNGQNIRARSLTKLSVRTEKKQQHEVLS